MPTMTVCTISMLIISFVFSHFAQHFIHNMTWGTRHDHDMVCDVQILVFTFNSHATTLVHRHLIYPFFMWKHSKCLLHKQFLTRLLLFWLSDLQKGTCTNLVLFQTGFLNKQTTTKTENGNFDFFMENQERKVI